MTYMIVKKGNNFKIKNKNTGKLHKNNFKTRSAAETQLKNRLRFQRLIEVIYCKSGTSPPPPPKLGYKCVVSI